MVRPVLTRRRVLQSAAGLGAVCLAGPARAAPVFTPDAGLVEAARKEGRVVLYTANFSEVEQEMINVFGKRFPFLRVEMVRASGGQLITRVRTEAAAGKLLADIVDHSDRGLMQELEPLFQDYAPPNAGDYVPTTLISPKLWPRITVGWSIAYHTELVKNPPKSWWDLTKPEYAGGQIGQVIAQSGGTTWTRIMFERQVLGNDYWAKQAATKPRLYPSGAPASDALVRGEVSISPLLYNIVFSKRRDGAPIEIFFPPEGVPIVPYATGIPKTAARPNAAKLYLDWCLSEEGQIFSIKEQGNLTSLKQPPYNPQGFDPKAEKVWIADFHEFQSLRDRWMEEWNKVYGYRQ
jgi:iron(III) transport system substrate-binding protein